MPNRILREGILTSEAVSSLSWAAEVYYRRLMSVVDDYGRFHALPKLVRAACYPLHIDKVSDLDIDTWTAECVAAGLVRVYPAADGKRYLEIVKFGQQLRAKSKFPQPNEGESTQSTPSDSNCYQPRANEHLVGVGVGVGVGVEDEGVVGDEGERARGRAKPEKRPSNSVAASDDFPLPAGLSREKWREWVQFRSSIRKPINETLAMRQADYLGEAIRSGHDAAAIIDESMRNGWTGLFAKDHHKRGREAPAETFRERDERNARQRWEEMTGRVHPENLKAQSRVIDITPAAAPLIPIGAAR
jgi:hypothetical protein